MRKFAGWILDFFGVERGQFAENGIEHQSAFQGGNNVARVRFGNFFKNLAFLIGALGDDLDKGQVICLHRGAKVW